MTRLSLLLATCLLACGGDPPWLTEWSCDADEYATADTHIGSDHTNVTCASTPPACQGADGFEAEDGPSGACLDALCPEPPETPEALAGGDLVVELWDEDKNVVDCDGPEPEA